MSDQPEKLSDDQKQLLATVAAAEQNLGGPGIDIDDQGNAIPPGAPGEDDASAAAENQAILQTLIAILTPALPFLPQVYTHDVIDRIANAYTAVEQKYGWNVRNMMGVEVQLAIVAIPPTIQAIAMGKAYFEMKKREAEKVINPDEAKDGSQQ